MKSPLVYNCKACLNSLLVAWEVLLCHWCPVVPPVGVTLLFPNVQHCCLRLSSVCLVVSSQPGLHQLAPQHALPDTRSAVHLNMTQQPGWPLVTAGTVLCVSHFFISGSTGKQCSGGAAATVCSHPQQQHLNVSKCAQWAGNVRPLPDQQWGLVGRAGRAADVCAPTHPTAVNSSSRLN